ncbi:MAG TPA: hypothetical protein VK117_01615, partial [Pyrinomonadaceae bacterium]|nr:hypothetical protein [Pyrinomonadaceae bacterium]
MLRDRVAVQNALRDGKSTINSRRFWEAASTWPDQIRKVIINEPITPQSPFARLFKIFAPAAAIPIQSTDPAEVSRQYRHWQKRVLLTSIIGYATFYFVRKNL